jgi:5-methylcytosine-specific restriction protein A
MPNKPRKLCKHPGCNQLVDTSYCNTHQQLHIEKRKEYDKHRPTYHDWYSNKRWRMLRIHWLKCNPICVMCNKIGRITPATIVDHVRPHKGSIDMFYDVSNLQSLCKQCHDSKTAREDGAFGNTIK